MRRIINAVYLTRSQTYISRGLMYRVGLAVTGKVLENRKAIFVVFLNAYYSTILSSRLK